MIPANKDNDKHILGGLFREGNMNNDLMNDQDCTEYNTCDMDDSDLEESSPNKKHEKIEYFTE